MFDDFGMYLMDIINMTVGLAKGLDVGIFSDAV